MSQKGPVVNISDGALQGRNQKTDNGCEYYSFQGIPYAKAPVGELRFQAPQAPEKWRGVRDATKEGSECCQLNILVGVITGAEDCLFLNVYTPRLPVNGGRDIPVMVYIHGGAFVMGCGNSDLYGPDYLVEEGIVLVTINYRLGPFGFLSLENEKVPGNAGLKDQVAALRWVRDNISAFGGNPDNVTIFGGSAGAASVHYLLLSDSSKGLFHQAISQSGSALNPWALQRKPKENAIRLCNSLGYATRDLNEVHKILKNASAYDLIAAHQKIPVGKLPIDMTTTLAPCKEKVYSGQDPFFTDDVYNRIKEGKFHQVPYITGFNSEEGLFMLKDLLNNKITYDDVNSDVQYIVPVDVPEDKATDVYKKLKKHYLNNAPVSKETILKYASLKGDTEFVFGINQAVKLHAKVSKNPVYHYRFSFEELGMFKLMMKIDLPGTSHSDDLGYLFKMSVINVPVEKDSKIEITRRRLVKLWTNFARTGNPTPTTQNLLPVLWQPVAKDKLNYLNIDSELSMRTNPEAERMAFLEELYRNI